MITIILLAAGLTEFGQRQLCCNMCMTVRFFPAAIRSLMTIHRPVDYIEIGAE